MLNAARATLRGWSGGLAAPAPDGAAFTGHWRQLSRYSAAFALLSDLALLTLGGGLKRREMLSARLGDILAELYLLAAALKRFEDEGRPEADKPLIEYIFAKGVYRMGVAFNGVLENLPARWAALTVRLLCFPYGIPLPAPTDDIVTELAEILMRPSSQRDRLTPDLYLGEGRAEHPVAELEEAFERVSAAAPIDRKMRAARLRDPQAALDQGIITAEEFGALAEIRQAVARVVAVDAFAMADVSPTAAQHRQEDAAGETERRADAAE